MNKNLSEDEDNDDGDVLWSVYSTELSLQYEAKLPISSHISMKTGNSCRDSLKHDQT